MKAPSPIVPYTALVGRIISDLRNRRGIHQTVLAQSLGISQSAYSRIETGDTTISLSQLRVVAQKLGATPSEILQRIDHAAHQLNAQGVAVSNEKPVNHGALLIGLGILAALLASAK